MRYPAEHKERTRKRLLARGGSHAKKHGFAGSGMDALAAAAGVTTGSLYKHFDGKADLFAALIDAELKRTAARFAAIEAGDVEAAANAVKGYLSPAHVRHPEAGCPLPSLAGEVARADRPVRDAFQDGLLAIHAIVAERFTGSAERAWSLVAQSVGAILLARAMPDERTRSALLDSVTAECLALLRERSVSSGRRGTPSLP